MYDLSETPPNMHESRHRIIGGLLSLMLVSMLVSGIVLFLTMIRGHGKVVSKEFIPAHVVHEPARRNGKYMSPARDIHYPDMYFLNVFNGYIEVSVHVDQATYDRICVGDDFPDSVPSVDTRAGSLAPAPMF